jgi:hypothetical protein
MPKYYVQSGQLQSIIDRPSVESAILGVLEKLHGKGIIVSPKICISERGWYDDKCFDTDFFLKTLYDNK